MYLCHFFNLVKNENSSKIIERKRVHGPQKIRQSLENNTVASIQILFALFFSLPTMKLTGYILYQGKIFTGKNKLATICIRHIHKHAYVVLHIYDKIRRKYSWQYNCIPHFCSQYLQLPFSTTKFVLPKNQQTPQLVMQLNLVKGPNCSPIVVLTRIGY